QPLVTPRSRSDGLARRWSMRRAIVLPLVLALLTCRDRRGPTAAPASASSPERPAPVADPLPSAPPPGRRGGMDVTFFVTGDTHFGFEDIEKVHEVALAAMKSLEGTPYPAAIGGKVGHPLGVLVAGDLTEQGRPPEWARFEAVMNALPFPV